jgi:hypothetical protein
MTVSNKACVHTFHDIFSNYLNFFNIIILIIIPSSFCVLLFSDIFRLLDMIFYISFVYDVLGHISQKF